MAKHITTADDVRSDSREVQPDELVVVHGDGVRVDSADTDVPLEQVRRRFGGVDGVAVVSGAAAGLGAAVLLLLVGAAAGSTALDRLEDRTLTIGALALALALTALGVAVAGYTAGRVSRYAGMRNGLLAGVVLLLVLGALVGGASAFDEVRGLTRPSWVDTDLAAPAAIAAAGAALLALLLAAFAGRIGAAWHDQVDRTLLHTRAGGLGNGDH